MTTEKVCSRCGEPKPLSEYRVTNKGKGQFYPRTYCRACEYARRAEDARRREGRRDPHADLLARFDLKRETWMARAACRGKGAGLFFPDCNESVADIVRETCDVCQVRQECLDYAERTRTYSGIWGGLSAKGRRRLRVEASS